MEERQAGSQSLNVANTHQTEYSTTEGFRNVMRDIIQKILPMDSRLHAVGPDLLPDSTRFTKIGVLAPSNSPKEMNNVQFLRVCHHKSIQCQYRLE